jgi:hypothetical protein
MLTWVVLHDAMLLRLPAALVVDICWLQSYRQPTQDDFMGAYKLLYNELQYCSWSFSCQMCSWLVWLQGCSGVVHMSSCGGVADQVLRCSVDQVIAVSSLFDLAARCFLNASQTASASATFGDDRPSAGG